MGGEEEEDVWERKEESSRSRAELDKTFGFGWKAGHCLANHSGVKLSSRGTSDDDLGRIDVKGKEKKQPIAESYFCLQTLQNFTRDSVPWDYPPLCRHDPRYSAL